ncbi:MAG: electron transport complex subunit RsxC [Faecousia sp.]
MENYTKYALKPYGELAEGLEGKDHLFVIACNKCFKAFEGLDEPDCDAFLRLADGLDKHITGTAKVDFLCNSTQTAKKLRELIPEGTEYVAVISCGLGIQTVAELTGLPVLACTNSLRQNGHHGMALTQKKCGACAQCYLNLTGGICPIVDCAKSLTNGQCGGAKNGKCEVNPDKDCAWQKIQERLAQQGRLEELKNQPIQIRDYSKVNHKAISDYVKAIRAERFEGYYGGVHPTEGVSGTEHLPLVRFPDPEVAVIPLSMHAGAPATPIVQVGDHVKVGQKIGQASAFISANIHASVSGTVIAIEERPHATRGKCLSVVIASDGKKELHESVRPGKTLEELTPEEIVGIVAEAGIVGMGGAGFPTAVKLKPGKPIEAVLLNGCECEPLLTADHRLLLEYTDQVIHGLQAIMKAVAAPRGVIVIEDNKPNAIERFRSKLEDIDNIEIVPVRTKYPQGAEKMLIKRVLGRSVPSGGLPADVGAVVCNVSTAKAISDAIRLGMPLIERIVTVTGDKIAHPGNFIAKIGTSAADLVARCGGITAPDAIVKAGGPMMGFIQETLDTPIMKGSNGIVALHSDHAEPTECIKCGRCVDVCPMELQPLYFAKLVMDPKALKERNIMDCMECRCCEYICSSKIPLVTLIKTGKNAVRGMK